MIRQLPRSGRGGRLWAAFSPELSDSQYGPYVRIGTRVALNRGGCIEHSGENPNECHVQRQLCDMCQWMACAQCPGGPDFAECLIATTNPCFNILSQEGYDATLCSAVALADYPNDHLCIAGSSAQRIMRWSRLASTQVCLFGGWRHVPDCTYVLLADHAVRGPCATGSMLCSPTTETLSNGQSL